jgi:hypothetical protein
VRGANNQLSAINHQPENSDFPLPPDTSGSDFQKALRLQKADDPAPELAEGKCPKQQSVVILKTALTWWVEKHFKQLQ